MNLRVNQNQMQYFVFDNQRKGTCYHEFYKGKWDEHTFWKSDSIFLHDDILSDGFAEAIAAVLPAYNPFGETEISAAEWQAISEVILTRDPKSQAIYNEAAIWLKDVFQTHPCFTILGI